MTKNRDKDLLNKTLQALEYGQELGYCSNCGHEEPLEIDAHQCLCPECGKTTRYGAFDILNMNC